MEDDAEFMRLTEILNSRQARERVWQEAIKLSSILFAIGLIATLCFRNSLNWKLPTSQNQFLLNTTGGDPGNSFWTSFLACPLFTVLLLGSDYQRWCLMKWAKREAADSR